MNIYEYNSNAVYNPERYLGGIYLTKHLICDNENQFVRRIFKLLSSVKPGEHDFVKWQNLFNRNAYHEVCNEYGVNPYYVWMTGKWMYSIIIRICCCVVNLIC